MDIDSGNRLAQIEGTSVDGTSTQTVFDTGTQPWSSETSAFDAYQRLQSQRVVFDGGNQQTKEYDSNNTHPYTELDVDEDSTGKPTAVQMKFDGQPNTADFSAVAQVLGSALGRALAPNNPFLAITASTVIGAAGQRLAQAFAASLATDGTKVDLSSVFTDFHVSIAGAGASSVASFLVAELGTKLGLNGFGAQLFDAAAGGFTGSVASQIAAKMATGASFDAAIGTLNFANAATNAAYGVSALFGSLLGNELVPAQTHDGAVGGQLLGAVGSAIGISAALANLLGSALNFLLPGVGSLIGTILGTLIGDAFGSVPHPAAVDLIDQHGYLYAATHYQVSASDGGDYSTPDQLVVPALAIINAYLGAVKGAALDHSKQVTLGYQANPVFYIDGVPGHPTIGEYLYPNAAVQDAALAVLQNTEVIGGDLLMKRAHQNSSSNHSPAPVVDPGSNGDPGATGTDTQASAAEQLSVMSGDLALAQDYENYLNNREAINALMAANPNSAFTAGWIATFARVSELGLNHVNTSDFLGGLVGYLDSVSKAGLGAVAANATVSHGGAGDSVITVSIKTANGIEVPGSLSAFADATSVSSDASGQTVQFQFGGSLAAGGLQRLGAGAAGGNGVNDLWFGGDGGQAFNGTGGHDILAGGAGNDTIHGGDGWDFVQGGAGNDSLFGDAGNDILRGGAGNDVLNGGAGFDTAVYGAAVGSYTLTSYSGTVAVLTHGADGSDRLQGIESLQFTDTALAPGAVATFDALAYIASYPDLIQAFSLNPQSGFDHYVGSGFAEGRSISFDPLQYIASNADLITAFGVNALAGEQHYIVNGFYEHRPTTSFDPFEYIASNADLIAAFGLNALSGEQHYITTGYYEGRPTHSFDAIEYIASNPDLIAAFGPDPLAGEKHYISDGFNEHRPTASFDAVKYLASNPDLIQAGFTPASAAQQYVSAGYFQHRPTTTFDAVEYLASNPDLIAAGFTPASALQHYVSNGYFEHRATTSFDALEYVASNTDLIHGFGLDTAAAEAQYVTAGFQQGRALATFDAAQYLANYPDLAAAYGSNNLVAARQHYITAGFDEGRTDLNPNHVVLHNPDGSTTTTIYDGADVATWNSFRTEQDAQGHITHQLGLNEGGSSWQNDYDVAGNQSWITKISVNDSSNHLVSQVTNNDDGTHTLLANDPANASAWSSFTMTFDAGWNFTSIGNVTNHDGSHTADMAQIWNSFDTLDWHPNPFTVSLAQPVSPASDGMPVVLDLDGNGVDIVQLGASTASFDMAGEGGREHTAWIGPGNGFLAIDLGADGKAGPDGVIDQAKEIVFTQWSPGAASDMAALRAVFDTNHNGTLDLGDARWSEFRIWQDANGDGVSQPGEVKTPAALGLASIGLEPDGPSQNFPDGSAIQGLAGFTRTDGSIGTAADVALAYQPGADHLFAAIHNDWHVV